MRRLWWDCSVAAAGDMLLGSLLDAGASIEEVRAGLQALELEDWSLQPVEVRRGAFRAIHAEIRVGGELEPGGPEDGQEQGHSHEQGHGHSQEQGHSQEHSHSHSPEHSHSHGHVHGGHPAHPHRPWREIRQLIASAELPERARERALRAFGRLARAEAKLHGMPVEEVALHEVGATDAILDIVGCCLALESLDIDEIHATPLPLGGGHVHGAHGRIPLPAPATLELCVGWPVQPAAWPGEWVTPTGAALITSLARPGGPPAMHPEAIGHGAGRRDPPQVANLVRALLGPADATPEAEVVVELNMNVDDMTGEHVAPLLARLLEAGALDAWATPTVMKKGRPGLILGVLCPEDRAEALGELALRHSSSLGLRRSRRSRRILDRWVQRVQTPYGPVRVKIGGRDGQAWHAAPELDDVLARARETDVAPQEVHQAALSAWRRTPTRP